MRVHDWRLADAADLDDAFATEILRWRDELHWDAGENWRQVHDACRDGVLPGFVAVDDTNRIVGWTFCLRRGQELQVGALNAPTLAVAEQLFDAVLASPSAEGATSVVFFGYSTAPRIQSLLASRGFDVERYLYLERLTSGPIAGPHAASWRDSLRDEVAALLASSYDATRTRVFARDGGLDGWRDYLSQLVSATGCGKFFPAGCQIVEAGDGSLDAAILTTRLDEHTVHFAQVAVAPRARGRGLAADLASAALSTAHDAGLTRATLLVGEQNGAARHIYQTLGFREVASFVSATLDGGRVSPRSLVLKASTPAPLPSTGRR